MPNEALATVALLQGDALPRTARRSRFFLGMSLLLLAFVLVGFAETFFLRAGFDVPPVPWYVYLHGVILTAWFLLVVVQASLVATRRINVHRRLGIGAAFLAAAVVAVSAVTVHSYPARAKAGNLSVDANSLAGFDPAVTSMVVWNDYFALATFALMIAAALYLRRRPETHKRLMLLASIAIIGPAIARILSLVSYTTGWSPVLQLPIMITLIGGVPLALVVHDLVTTRRVHAASGWGVAWLFVQMFAATAVATSTAGRALVIPPG